MPVKVIIHEKKQLEQDAFRVQTMHLAYKNGIWRTKLAFRLQICSFQFTNKHLVLQTGVSDYNSAYSHDSIDDVVTEHQLKVTIMGEKVVKTEKDIITKDNYRQLLYYDYEQ